MGERLVTRWWSLELCEGWSASSNEDCTTVESTPSLGALQFSEIFKDRDAVTDRDLMEYARKCLGQQVQLGPVRLRDFVGYSAHYEREGLSWSEYWLRVGAMLLYVTYNATVDDDKAGPSGGRGGGRGGARCGGQSPWKASHRHLRNHHRPSAAHSTSNSKSVGLNEPLLLLHPYLRFELRDSRTTIPAFPVHSSSRSAPSV